jgi:diguanylate cyclase (GGDEF)-like protein
MIFVLPRPELRKDLPAPGISEQQACVVHPSDGDQREAGRLEALDRYDILDTGSEEAFDRVTRLAKKIFDVPMALVTLLDNHRSWVKSSDGLNIPEARRSDSFCQYTILQAEPLVITDACADPRFSANPYVAGVPHIRFYAGVPLTTPDGFNIGSLCAVDMKAREFSAAQVEILVDLGRMVVAELELRRLAVTDGLTGALSRRGLKEQAGKAISLALRHHQPLSCIAFDLDHFKTINDTFGHARGDEILTATVRTCREQLRESDIIGRMGGEEFCVILPQTAAAGAMEVAERLRGAIAGISQEDGLPAVTASFGVAPLEQSARDVDALHSNADAALYAAKAEGRNRARQFRQVENDKPLIGRRVLKAGQMIFNGGTSSIDCTVRRLSETGAALDVISSVGVPTNFNLFIIADGVSKPARVVTQTERQIVVDFLAQAA